MEKLANWLSGLKKGNRVSQPVRSTESKQHVDSVFLTRDWIDKKKKQKKHCAALTCTLFPCFVWAGTISNNDFNPFKILTQLIAFLKNLHRFWLEHFYSHASSTAINLSHNGIRKE